MFRKLRDSWITSHRNVQEFKLGLNYRFGATPVVARY